MYFPQYVQDVRIKEHKMEFGMFSPLYFSTISTRCEHKGTQNGIWNA
jgi:hypothetical protein